MFGSRYAFLTKIVAYLPIGVLNDVSQLELILHLLLVVVSLLSCYSRKVLSAVGKDYCTAGIDQQTTIVVHAILAYLLE